MIDKKLIKYIVDEAMLLPGDIVLEIGYGHGELTKELAKKCKVIAVDIDDYGVSCKNVIFVKGNILDLLGELYEKYSFNKIVANIPYNISEPLMKSIFKINVELILLTVGQNFSEILTSKNSRMGIIVNELYDVEILKVISPKSFRPMPRVDSALVFMEQRDIDIVDKPAVIYKELVMLEDKKLRNALIKILVGTKKDLKKKLENELFEKKLYQLSNKEFIKLDEILREIK
jgi:16S rRNA A1518/A1519 N6-dimethyltransferase RsmA/KsgA/DIM1 with predicted DNA glycosylase/AP lyase activity